MVAMDPTLHGIYVPRGWSASVFAAGPQFDKPRFMTWGPDSVLYVANMNKNNVLALPDLNRDGVADAVVTATSASAYCHDIKFYRDTMYLCQEGGVTRVWRTDPFSYNYSQRSVLIDKSSQPGQTGGNHRTRTLVLDTNSRKIYVSVGSRANADRESDRALIEQYEWDGSGRRFYATGIRNAVGMTLHPRTGQLWANNNGSDLQGDNVPPEWVDIVRDGGFYGYPVAYNHQIWMDFTKSGYGDLLPITAQDSANVRSMVPPAALIWAHCAPMAMEFSHENMPEPYRNGCFVVLRGSWNRSPVSGTKVIFLEFDNDLDTVANVAREFCTGFIRDSTNVSTRWARPVGIALGRDGSVYLSLDDLKECILKLTPPQTTQVREESDHGYLRMDVRPNPAADVIHVTLHDSLDRFSARLVDLDGKLVREERGEGAVTIDTSDLASGSYVVHIHVGDRSTARRIELLK
jgi:glucose/arabinose dehydrogenase